MTENKHEECVQSKETQLGRITVKMCTMVDGCDCGKFDCCSKIGGK